MDYCDIYSGDWTVIDNSVEYLGMGEFSGGGYFSNSRCDRSVSRNDFWNF